MERRECRRDGAESLDRERTLVNELSDGILAAEAERCCGLGVKFEDCEDWRCGEDEGGSEAMAVLAGRDWAFVCG